MVARMLAGRFDKVRARPGAAGARRAAIAILAALEHRRRTRRGQYIDLSQAEASTHFLTPAILDYTVNGRELDRMGNVDAHHAPHGVYPAAGDDRWAAIVCRRDGEWRALCSVMERGDLASDPRLESAAGRIEHRAEVDRAIAQWTRQGEPDEIERLLQSRDIPAHAVNSSRECFADPQLRHRGHFVELDHAVYGKTIVEGSRAKLSRTPAEVTRAAPTLGRDNQHVLGELLGYDEETIAHLVVSGVMG
jgi:benzylsuccinate CoA-transferase BbsF subunit